MPYWGWRVVGEVTPLIAQVSNSRPRGWWWSVPGGPAARGGVQSNDTVVAADGQDVRTGAELQAGHLPPQAGEQTRLRGGRQGSTTPVDVTATLVEAPARPRRPPFPVLLGLREYHCSWASGRP